MELVVRRIIRLFLKRRAETAMACFISLMAVWILGSVVRIAASRTPPIFPPPRRPEGKLAAVSCNDERCARIGLDAIRKGENSADAVSSPGVMSIAPSHAKGKRVKGVVVLTLYRWWPPSCVMVLSAGTSS